MSPETELSTPSRSSRLTAQGHWNLLADPIGRPGWYNMALDQWLLDRSERTGEGFVRLYCWEPFCLSFGRNEPASRRYRREAIESRGIDVVRRPTGGRAVWHARELTYSVVAPVSAFGDDPSRPLCRNAFDQIHAMLLRAVRALGARVEMAAPDKSTPIGAGACFASSAGGELIVDGQKLLGSAQVRQGNAFLQHGSLLLEDDQRLVEELTVGDVSPGQETTLRQATGRSVGFIEASLAVTRAARSWEGAWQAWEGPKEDELAGIGERYRDPAWIWRR